jgi:integron integrase
VGVKLLGQVRAALRLRHYSRRTERAYVSWTRRFILFSGKRHPSEMGESEISGFLSHLAVAGKVSASTQNQALSALLFLYREVLRRELPWMDEIVRAKRPQRLPTVLSREEVAALLREMKGVEHLMASLLYGAGLRLLECCRLRVQDLDDSRGEITVRDGKGGKDRITLWPCRLHAPIAAHLERVRAQHERDLASGLGSVELPSALERKYPRAAFEWGWQWVFRRRGSIWTPRAAAAEGTTCTSRCCNVPFTKRRSGRGFRGRPRAMLCGTRSRPTCSKMGTTFERSRNCSATAT